MRYVMLSLLACLLVLVAMVGTASAATWVVKPDSTGDAPTIQAGIDSAGAGDTILVIFGIYYEHDISLKSGLYLTSETGMADCVTINAQGLGRIFACPVVDSTTSVIGFTATNGSHSSATGGGMYCDISDARFTNCRFLHNTVRDPSLVRGGGVHLEGGSPVFTDCEFSWNRAVGTGSYPSGGMGGGVNAYGGSPEFVRCTFSHNSVDSVTICHSGGGVCCAGFCSPVFKDCVFESNLAYGAYTANNTTSVFLNCVFRNNEAPSYCIGGGVFCQSDWAIFEDCLFEGNTSVSAAGTGGGLLLDHVAATVTRCRFYDNDGRGSGGGVYVQGCGASPSIFSNCVFAGNYVQSYIADPCGGAIALTDEASVELIGCTFSGNSSRVNGGGICCVGGSYVSLDHCIVAFSQNGEAVYWNGTGVEPDLSCCDLYGNEGGDWVGAIADQYGINGNISEDPMFLAPEYYNFYLRPGSPCLNPPGCNTMGAYGVSGFAVTAIVDIPDDDGGQVQVTWQRIAFDSAGSDTTVEAYTLWRRTDEPVSLGSVDESPHLPGLLAEPPGTWERVDSVVATGEETYMVTCPTVCDSTDEGISWSVFFIRAHCSDPVLEFDTEPDSGYSTDNRAWEGWTDVTRGVLGNPSPGSGLAWVDYDNDGRLDIYFTNRTDIVNKLLRNVNLTAEGFVDVTPTVLAGASNSRGCPWGDYDNDGDMDVYINNKGANELIRNDGGGNFVDVTAPPLDDAGTGQAAAWADYDNDGDLDLYVVNNGANKLFRNDSAGVFTDATVGPLGDASWGIGMAWGDYDGDGDMDIYLANYDNTANVLMQNEGGGVFSDVTTPVLAIALSSYGAAWGDYDNDGDLDLYVTNEGPNKLIRNDGGIFTDVSTFPVNNGGEGRSVAWGDYNLDGSLDLYVVNYDGDNALFRNEGDGTFSIPGCTACPFEHSGEGFSTAWADYDQDGDLDLYVVNDATNVLLRNDLAPGHHWLEIDPVGVVSNTGGVGARVRIVAGGISQMREIAGASGYASQGPLTAWFGLGNETVVDTVEVIWPASGIVQRLTAVSCDQTLEVVEDDMSGLVDTKPVPAVFRLHPSRPNPFSAETAIRYDLPQAAQVDLAIYDVSGRLVLRVLEGQPNKPGYHTVYWNGRNAMGVQVAPGVYFCRLSAGTHTAIERMLLLR